MIFMFKKVPLLPLDFMVTNRLTGNCPFSLNTAALSKQLEIIYEDGRI